jgi:hypothetical protein
VVLDGASIAVSSSPAGGGAAWKEFQLDPGHGLVAASCPSQKFCAVLGDEGALFTSTLFTSTEPAGPASSWQATELQRPTRQQATRVYCATTSLCFVTNDDTQIAVSADPRGGASAWKVLKAPVPIFSISCVSRTLCVGAGLEQVVPVRVTVPPTAPTTAEVRARLMRALTVRGRGAKLSQVSKRGGYRLRFSAPAAGNLVIRWYLPRHGRHAGTLIAGASMRFTSRATRVIKVNLTRAGRRFLHGIRKPHRIRLRASGSFTPAGHRPVRVTKAVVLTP